MDIDAMLVPFPPVLTADPQAVADAVRRSGRVLVVLDDDPTGTQSVADLPVLTNWGRDDFEWAFSTSAPAVYVLTNSRSFDSATAERINREIVTAAVEAARERGIRVAFASRGDSTLRGHFPLEPDVIRDTLAELGEPRPDGVVLVPAFPDAGRVTIGGVHGLVAEGVFTPVGDSEFARDSTFGFRSSRLAEWVEEKSGGRIPSSAVVELTLDVIRAGADLIAEALLGAPDGSVIAVDVVEEDDLRQLALGLELAEAAGRSFVYRVGPPFVRARVGQAPRAPIGFDTTDAAASATRGGLVVVGSHVGLTSRQLAHLKEHRPGALVVELDVPSILDPARSTGVIDDAVLSAVEGLAAGDVILHSSRTLIRTDDPDESLAISRTVSDALVAVVSRTLAAQPPRFVIAKGGITSSDVASRGLSIGRAVVRGSLFPGIVSVWQPADGPAAGIPYVVFAGNVGGDTTLTEAVDKLSISAGDSAAAAASHRKDTDMTTPVVAVLGLGAMGLPMASRLAEDLTVRGFDIAGARLELAEAAGIVRSDSAAAAVDGADAVLLAVRDSAQLGEVLFGENGIAASLRAGAVVILTSTVGTDGIADVATRLAELGVDLIDAPLSGGPARAGAGDLLIVVGATPEAREKAQPVLGRLASTLTVVGDRPGDGQALKTVNQLLCGVHIAAAAEALALADALGLDPERTLAALGAGAAASFMLANRGPRALQAYDDEGAPVLSRLDIFVKDMGIVTKAARNARLATPVAAAAEQLYLLGEAQGLAAADDSAVIKVVAPQRRTA